MYIIMNECLHFRYNTAFITFLNHEVTSSKQNSIITLAHEVGHSFGAYHDQDTSCNSEVRIIWKQKFISQNFCFQAEQYIMSAKGTDTQKDEFSTCSLNDINAKLGEVSSKLSECFTDRFQVCKHHQFKIFILMIILITEGMSTFVLIFDFLRSYGYHSFDCLVNLVKQF